LGAVVLVGRWLIILSRDGTGDVAYYTEGTG
jgi:hypothetical protein